MGFFFNSVSKAKKPKEKVYAGLKGAGTIGSALGVSTSGFRGAGYDLLEASNDRLALTKQLKGQGTSVARRIAFKGAAQGLNMAFRSLAPDLGGLGGRAMNIAFGKASARALGYMDRIVFRAKLEVNPKRMDRAIQRDLIKIDSPMTLWQRRTQALAIATAPDPYAMAKAQKELNRSQNIDDLSIGDDILSAYTLKSYSGDEIDALMKRADVDEIMSSKVRKPSKTDSGYHPDKVRTSMSADGVMVTQSTRVHKAKEIEKKALDLDPEFFDYLIEGTGATYAFGTISSASKQDILDTTKELLQTVAETERAKDVIKLTNHVEMSADQYMHILATNVLHFHMMGGDITKKGKLRQQARVVRGDLVQQGVAKRKRWVRDGFIAGDSSNVLEEKAGFGWKNKYDQSSQSVVSVQEKIKGNHKKPNWKQVTDKIDDPISNKPMITTSFSANRQRHNYVPTRQHIQKAIHALKPDLKNKKTLASFYVDFGGLTEKSKTADAQRDAFQIEFGGLATDKHGGVNERTDGYVYLPSLFIYRSATNAAGTIGLAKGVKKGKFKMTGSDAAMIMKSSKFKKGVKKTKVGGMSRFAGDAAYLAVNFRSATATRETRNVLDDLAATAKTSKSGDAMVKDGALVLRGSELGVTRHDLEMISEMINPNFAGGSSSKLSKSVRGGAGQTPFAKAIDEYDFTRNPQGNFFEVQKQQNNLLKAKGKEVGRYAQVDGETINLIPGSLLRQGVDMDNLIMADLQNDILEAAPDIATRKLSQAGLLANGQRLKNELYIGFRTKFKQQAAGSVDEAALDAAANKAVEETLLIISKQMEKYPADIVAFVAAADRLGSVLIDHITRFGKVGIRNQKKRRQPKRENGRLKIVNPEAGGKGSSAQFAEAVPGGSLYDPDTASFLPQGKFVGGELTDDAIRRIRNGEPSYRDFVALLNDKEHLRQIMKVEVLDSTGKVRPVNEIAAEMQTNFNTLSANRTMNLNNERNEIPKVGGRRGSRKKGPETARSSRLDEARAGQPQPLVDNGLVATSANTVYDDIVKKVGGMTTKKQQVDGFEAVVSAVENGRKIGNQTIFLEVRDATELVLRKGFLQQGYVEHARRNHAAFSESAGIPFQADTSLVGIQRYIVSLVQGSSAFQSRQRDIDEENEYDFFDLDDDFSE